MALFAGICIGIIGGLVWSSRLRQGLGVTIFCVTIAVSAMVGAVVTLIGM